jgi:hypothetical protein
MVLIHDENEVAEWFGGLMNENVLSTIPAIPIATKMVLHLPSLNRQVVKPVDPAKGSAVVKHTRRANVGLSPSLPRDDFDGRSPTRIAGYPPLRRDGG